MTENTVRLGDVADFVNGVAFKNTDWCLDGIRPIIRIQNLNDKDKPYNRTSREVSERHIARAGDLLVSWSASLGVFEWQGEEACVNQHIFKVVPDYKKISHQYMRKVLEAFIEEIALQAHGATMKHVTRDRFLSVRIPLPSVNKQKRIAAILDATDALRAKRRETLAQLDAFLQSTFIEMFGDPVTNPKGWKQIMLSSLVDASDRINYGVVQPGEEFPAGKPLIRVGDFVGGSIDFSGIKMIDPNVERKYQRSRLRGNELLISCVGSIGTICKVSSQAVGFNIARAVARVPLREEVSSDFMLYCLRSDVIQRYFLKETRTVSQPTLNISLIKAALVIQPPFDLQRRFAAIVESVEQQKAKMRGHLTELDALFASLQHRAFNGEL